MPHGVLLSGPPGTGKTLLARAMAGEADVPFFSMSASEFIEMIVGVGASRVRDLFAQAKEAAPAIVFIDELDAIGRRAAAARTFTGGSDEREQTLNQILTEMDGFDPRSGIIVLAATNRPDVLDPALLRPGRFDRRVHVPRPTRRAAVGILAVHTRVAAAGSRRRPRRRGRHDARHDRRRPGQPGQRGRALTAARRGQDAGPQRDFTDALERIVLGAERKVAQRSTTAADRLPRGGPRAGRHVHPGADPVRKISIIPRGQALGVTFSAPDADRYSYDERICARRSASRSAVAPPRSSSSARTPRAPSPTSSRSPTSPGGWWRAGA